METNETERRRWNNPDWVAVWPKRERMTDVITPFLLDALALRPGERVLDVGCGGGKATIAAAEAVGPSGTVVGADVSVPLTDLAVQRAADAGIDNVSFRVLDVQQDRIVGDPFDVAMSQFGVMFFDDPVAAFANIRTHLGPSGRIGFACWQTIDRNPWFIGTALAGLVPPPPAPQPGKSPTGPFAFADPTRTQQILEAAGFTHVHRSAHELVAELPNDAVVDEAQLTFMGVPPDRLAAATAAVNDHLAQFRSGPGLAKFPLAFQVFHATVG
ncbi:MAG TPA: class I SAM-dependent methyltransferase [Acidimicrobiia bacterium]|nr:class I SAM-dependent methyltransferase [Acidimicrobiia bacterium]